MKKIVIVAALAGFIKNFLAHDIYVLQNMGYEVHGAGNIHHPGNEGVIEYFEEKGVIFHSIKFSSNRPISKETITSYIEFKKLIKEIEFDAVHIHTPIPGAICRWACRKKRAEGIKVIYTTHGFYFHKGASIKSWTIYWSIEKLMSRFTDTIITINYEDFKNAQKMYANKVYHINGIGVDTEKYRKINIDREKYRTSIHVKKNEIMILGVGELSKRKNHRIIIEAISKLRIKNIVFVICGNAMNKAATTEELKETARKYGVRLILLGLRKDIPEICHCADIGVLPSTREGLGLSGIEMLASGLPLVASRIHGILDYMQDGINGYLADPYSADSFAKGIQKLLDQNVRKSMKDICQNSVKKFDKGISFEQIEKIYYTELS